jgi:hypothetical protein
MRGSTHPLLMRCGRWAALLLMAGTAIAQENDTAAASSPAADVQRTCTRCHDETDPGGVLNMLKSKHAMRGDARTPFADKACATCHGDSEDHMKAPPEGQERASPIASSLRACFRRHDTEWCPPQPPPGAWHAWRAAHERQTSPAPPATSCMSAMIRSWPRTRSRRSA